MYGIVKGHPVRYISGHGTRKPVTKSYRMATSNITEHAVIAVSVLGKPLPKGAEIHHVDGKKHNNTRANLVICQDHAYHALLHVRARVLKAGGNPNTDRYCGTCRQVKPRDEFLRSGLTVDGRTGKCLLCNREWWRGRKYTRNRKQVA